jgi:hypothetical protein
MDLTPYVEALRTDLEAAAAAGTDDTRATARLLSGALDASLRLCLVDALSTMAAEVSAASELGSVEIRMHGREPEVVVLPDAGGPPEAPAAPPPPPGGAGPEGDDDAGTARVTLRLPESLKAQAEQRAASEGLSVNGWLVRAVALAVRSADPRPAGPTGGPFAARGRRISGFARS